MTEARLLARLSTLDLFPATGQVRRLAAGEIEASGPDVSVAALCEITPANDMATPILARVVSVTEQTIRMVPFGGIEAIRIGDRVRHVPEERACPVGDALAGRAIDAMGAPIDGGRALAADPWRSVLPRVLDRIAPTRPIATGIRAIDGLLTLGHGQRIGIFAASGVGKTKLIEQIIRQTTSERTVICMIGERGREVEAMWTQLRASGRLDRVSLVAATSDESAPMRARAIEQALAMAEFWRAAGENVLLVADSITRHAMALREIGLTAGEPPMLRAYTPNVLRELPRVVERCGAVRGRGSITGLFTVLAEGDEADDPIVEVMKSLLDGHIVLSRRLAEGGHFPAIDVGRSISRMFDRLVGADQASAAREVRALLAKFEESRILVESGVYKAGADKELDRAITARVGITAFLKQSDTAPESAETTARLLADIAGKRGGNAG